MNKTMASSAENVQIRVPGEARFLALIRSVTTMLARNAGFPDVDVDKIELAVDEACSNVVEHAYRKASPKPAIELEIRWEPGRFIVDIVDRGIPFDFAKHVTPKFPDHWISGECRGAGLFLIRSCMDETEYESQPGQANRLRLVKRLQPT
ncbi:MAG TPA: ATP-binding protein [Kiritimatiellia bacterium]|nr:ATP-binding protein [Kiritimatiellia bacterium]HRZ13133.1 ATP-binding protein [Kiritimatiellia bacterium]HSA17554.1 ATP-binding protein [Kiritimatiellia bacterium]